jgi:ribosome biogenesis GTPase
VDSGALPEERLKSFAKLQREQAHHARQVSTTAQREHKRSQRDLTLEGWERSRSKRRGD